MAVWPAYAEIAADGYGVRQDPDVRRSQLDDGAVRQERTYTSAFTVRRVQVVLVSDADQVSFRDWCEANAHLWFTYHDPEDGVARRARVRGGAGGVDYRAVVGRDRVRRWEARLELEGLRSDTV